jgi:hypothetical protein
MRTSFHGHNKTGLVAQIDENPNGTAKVRIFDEHDKKVAERFHNTYNKAVKETEQHGYELFNSYEWTSKKEKKSEE